LFSSKKLLSGIVSIIVFVFLLAGCGSNETKETKGAGAVESTPSPSAKASESPGTSAVSAVRKYKDSKGREVEIPVHPQRIAYVGSDPGDLFALGVRPLGASLSVIGTQVAYPDLLEGIEDIGYPADLEKVMSLDPDLILFSDWDDAAITPLEKIAPTVGIGEASTFERMDLYADILGKQAEAEAFKGGYEAKAAAVKEKLKSVLPEGENASATVLLQLGKDLYVMGHQGLSVTLYETLGFVPPKQVRKLIDAGERFAGISAEVVADYAGDEIFVLTDDSEETAKETKGLLESPIWATLSAVKNERVHVLDSRWNFDDPVTRDRLLDELEITME